MAYSYFDYKGTDTTIQTNILCVSTEHMYAFKVLSEEKSSVTLSDVALAATFTKNNAGVLCELKTAPSTKIRVIRSTPYDVLMHDFSNGAQFNADSVDEVYEQLLYLCQEIVEGKLIIDSSGNFGGPCAGGISQDELQKQLAAAKAAGYAAGDAAGYARGYSEGYAAGYARGYSEGYAAGKADGYSAGKADGYADGYSAGKAAGYSAGYSTGEAAGKASCSGSGDGLQYVYKQTVYGSVKYGSTPEEACSGVMTSYKLNMRLENGTCNAYDSEGKLASNHGVPEKIALKGL